MMSSKPRKTINVSTTDDRKQRKVHNRHNKRHPKIESQQHTSDETDHKTPLKLTIKIGGQTLGEKSVIKSSIRSLNSVSANQSIDENSSEEPSDMPIVFDYEEEENYVLEEEITDDLEEPDEEEEWLDALEEGRLHEVDDELKKIRDPKLMTARQRALLENKSLKGKSESIKSIGSQETDKKMTEEMIERKLVKDRRRRQQAEEKKEKDKKQTIDRLLRKRQELAQKVKKKKKTETPKITYKNCQNGIFICLPIGIPLEQIMDPKRMESRPSSGTKTLKCSRKGCENEKKYLCSKSRQFVCSLQCYKEVNKII